MVDKMNEMKESRGELPLIWDRPNQDFFRYRTDAEMTAGDKKVREERAQPGTAGHREEGHQKLRAFVEMVAFDVLNRCGVATGRQGEESDGGHVQRLAKQTMTGLPELPDPYMHTYPTVAAAVVGKLRRKFGKETLRFVLLYPDQWVEATVVKCFQKQVIKHLTDDEPSVLMMLVNTTKDRVMRAFGFAF